MTALASEVSRRFAGSDAALLLLLLSRCRSCSRRVGVVSPSRPSVRSPPLPRHVRCRRPAAEARRAAAHRVQHHAHAAVADDQGDRRVHGAGEGERPVPVRHRQEGKPVHGEGRLRHTIGDARLCCEAAAVHGLRESRSPLTVGRTKPQCVDMPLAFC